jgi:hypothetical protein
MNWQLRSIAWTRLGGEPQDTIMISGRLHGPDRCTCSQCMALESTAAMVAELLRPGESRQIAIADSPLFLTIKRFSPRSGRSSITAVSAMGDRRHPSGRGDFLSV